MCVTLISTKVLRKYLVEQGLRSVSRGRLLPSARADARFVPQMSAPDAYTSAISTGNFTQPRVKIEMRDLMHLKRGDKHIYTRLSTTPSVAPDVEAPMIIRPWTL
jgi:hypothetical protein